MIKLQQLIIEGRYDSVTTELSRALIQALKKKSKRGKIYFDFPVKQRIKIDGLQDMEFNQEILLKYDIEYDNEFIMGFDIYGQADDEMIELSLTINPSKLPGLFSEIVPILKDAIRHELEHVAQNNLDRPDSERYERTPKGDYYRYFTARHEIPAFVRGLYKQAKTRRYPLDVIIDKFLSDYSHTLTSDESEKVRKIWTDYAKRNLPKAQFSA